jgi:hypothetical protein
MVRIFIEKIAKSLIRGSSAGINREGSDGSCTSPSPSRNTQCASSFVFMAFATRCAQGTMSSGHPSRWRTVNPLPLSHVRHPSTDTVPRCAVGRSRRRSSSLTPANSAKTETPQSRSCFWCSFCGFGILNPPVYMVSLLGYLKPVPILRSYAGCPILRVSCKSLP